MYLLTDQPLTIYPGKILPDIVTRNDLLPKPNGDASNPPFSWPRVGTRLFSYEPYLSLLEPHLLNIEKAVNDGNIRPIDSGYMCPDADIEKEIYLIVQKSDGDIAPRDRHWAVRWTVFSRGSAPTQSHRNIEIKSGEGTGLAGEKSKYLINYGPWTSAEHVDSPLGMLAVPLGALTLEQRRILEAISWNVGVESPNGDFNCQNWLAAVLSVAVAKGIFAEDSVRTAINRALIGPIEMLEGMFIHCRHELVLSLDLIRPTDFVHTLPKGF